MSSEGGKATTTKFVGGRRFIDADTGEVIDAQVIVRSAADAGFRKIWLGHILELVEETGNAKMRALMWMLDQADDQNRLIATFDAIAEATGVSRTTVARLLKSLQDANVISQVHRSVWRINPEVIFRGNHSKRMNVLIQYRSERESKRPTKVVDAEVRQRTSVDRSAPKRSPLRTAKGRDLQPSMT